MADAIDDGLIKAAERALNYIENTESELGIKLESGDMLREALSRHKAPLSEIQYNKVSKPL